MKKIAILSTAFILLMLLIGCSSKSFSYEFCQEQANIKCVEISKFDYDSKVITSLVTLSKENVNIMINDIKSLECYEFFALDPLLSYGDVVICITYYDGEIEVLGITNIGYISQNGNWTTTRKYFNIEDICDVMRKFVDNETLSEISDYF